MNLSTSIKTLRLKVDGTNYTGAADTSDLTSEYVDTQGFEGCRFVVGFGALTSTAVTSIKVQQCDTSDGSYSDLTGTSITVADDDDNKIAIVDIYRPRERYLKLVTDRGTANAVVDFLVAELYGATAHPVSQSSSIVISQEVHASPAEGTA
jgi:hypothetical protein